MCEVLLDQDLSNGYRLVNEFFTNSKYSKKDLPPKYFPLLIEEAFNNKVIKSILSEAQLRYFLKDLI